MYPNDFWDQVSSFLRLKKPKEPNGFQSAAHFRRILEMERARFNRTGSRFSIVLFDTGNSNNGMPQHISRVLKARLRITDKAGWFDNRQVGVVMPYTSAQGAWKFAKDVCKALVGDSQIPLCTVYTYPSGWFCGIFKENR
jgi:hypothetical protein